MATGQPALEGAKLVNEIVEFAQGGNLSDFVRAKFNARAKALRETDQFHAALALGMLAAIAYNESDARSQHERAIQLRPRDYFAKAQYSASLQRLNLFSEAREMGLQAYHLNPANPVAILSALQLCTATCAIEQTNDLLRQWAKTQPEAEVPFAGIIRKANDYLSLVGAKGGDVEQLINIALTLLRDEKAYSEKWSMDVLADEDSTFMAYDLILSYPVERVVELNVRLSERLARIEPPMMIEDHVTVMYLTNDSE